MLKLCLAAFVVLTLATGCQQNDKSMRTGNQTVVGVSKGARSVAATGADGRLTRKHVSPAQARPDAQNQRPDWDWLGVTQNAGKTAGGEAATVAGSSKRPDWDWLGIPGKGQEAKSGSQQVAMGDWLVRPPEKRQQWGHVKARHKSDTWTLPPDRPSLEKPTKSSGIAPAGETQSLPSPSPIAVPE